MTRLPSHFGKPDTEHRRSLLGREQHSVSIRQAAVAELAKTAPRADGIDVQLTECVSSWLDSRTTLIGCASGHLLVATVPSEGGIVRRIMVGAFMLPQPQTQIKINIKLQIQIDIQTQAQSSDLSSVVRR
jgi:hypothetical protein